MREIQKKQCLLLTPITGSLVEIVSQLSSAIQEQYTTQNLIIDLEAQENLNLEGLLLFLELSNTHRGAGKSLVFVNKYIDYDTIPDEILVVPTVQEAEDIIEMEEIERDLGF